MYTHSQKAKSQFPKPKVLWILWFWELSFCISWTGQFPKMNNLMGLIMVIWDYSFLGTGQFTFFHLVPPPPTHPSISHTSHNSITSCTSHKSSPPPLRSGTCRGLRFLLSFLAAQVRATCARLVQKDISWQILFPLLAIILLAQRPVPVRYTDKVITTYRNPLEGCTGKETRRW